MIWQAGYSFIDILGILIRSLLGWWGGGALRILRDVNGGGGSEFSDETFYEVGEGIRGIHIPLCDSFFFLFSFGGGGRAWRRGEERRGERGGGFTEQDMAGQGADSAIISWPGRLQSHKGPFPAPRLSHRLLSLYLTRTAIRRPARRRLTKQ